MKSLSVAATVVSVLVLSLTPAHAQDSPVERARRERDAGNLAIAARILSEHLATAPADGEATRLLAQTLYWLQDVAGARRVYEAGLQRHPQDGWLRVEYGRLLVETGERHDAEALLVPLRTHPDVGAEATALLGTAAYWRGDLSTARELFADALAQNPGHTEAARQLQELRRTTSPWIRVAPSLWHDDQPLDRGGVGLEAGWYATPLTPVRLRLEPTRYSSVSRTHTFWAAEADVRYAAPAAHIETEAAIGVLRRTLDDERQVDWTGRVIAGLRGGPVRLRGRVDRLVYLHTTTALDAAIVVRAVAAELKLDHPRGWLGEVVVQRQNYPDDNVVRTTYGWLLAPLVHHPRVQVQGGYAFARDDAEESRFVLARPRQAFPPADQRFDFSGRYEPYYTPANVEKHAALAALTIRPSGRTTIRLGGSRFIHAQEDAPALVPAPGGVAPVFTTREFSPWDARGSVEWAVGESLTVTIAGEGGRGSFYRWSTGSVQLTYRFVGASTRATTAAP